MCGIFGILSTKKENLLYKIINGLKQLQNRGYDSAGLCYLEKQKEEYEFIVRKYASSGEINALDKLAEVCAKELCDAEFQIGFGHNRWATHGMKTNINAHPHLSNNKIFSIVHNGIIENFHEVKQYLVKSGYVFYSQTDTEIIVNLIEHFYMLNHDEIDHVYQNKISSTEQINYAIQRAINMLHGTFGLIIQCIYDENGLYCVRNGSPILIGYNDEYAVITSETSGFCNLVSNYFILHNNDICRISLFGNSASFSQKIQVNTISHYNLLNLEKQIYQTTPSPYVHWTHKEIHEQPDIVLRALNNGGRICKNETGDQEKKENYPYVKLGGLEPFAPYLKNINHLVLLGCGTSYFSCCYGSHFLKSLCKFDTVQVFDGADFNENVDLPKNGKVAFVLVSQSGETRDLYRCIEIAKNNNIFTIGIINVVNSLIAREVECGIYCNAGKEVAVASTKAFTSQVVCLSLMACWFSKLQNCDCHIKQKHIIDDLYNLGNDIKKTIEICEPFIRDFCSMNNKENSVFQNTQNMFVLGKGCDEYIAREGALKIKEISYIHAEGYSASSLKHGPFALLDANFPCVLLNTEQQYDTKLINCYEEVLSRGSPVLVISSSKFVYMKYGICEKTMKANNRICFIPENKNYSSLLAIIPLQLLAYYLAIYRNINPDQPKNLAKVVTVE